MSASPSTFLQKSEKHVFQTIKAICEIPSPTFHEERKMQFLLRKLSSLGLKDIRLDTEGNAMGFLINDPKDKRYVLLCAHADTACEAPLPIRVKDDGTFLYAHGICDNSAGVTSLLTFLEFVREEKIVLRRNYLIGCTVGEEGLGAKRGMKALMNKYAGQIAYVVNIESHDIGRITNACVGQYRARLTISAKQKGAHSWRNFGEPNAVVILASIIRDLSKVRLPKDTTYNVTAIQGGKSINAIPNEAQCLLEFRAKEQKNIDRLVKRLQMILRAYENRAASCGLEVLAVTEAASMPNDLPLYTITRRVQESLGISQYFKLGNTDGDVPLAQGIPTVTLGSGNGFATHSLEEKLEKKTYLKGIVQVIEIILTLDREMAK